MMKTWFNRMTESFSRRQNKKKDNKKQVKEKSHRKLFAFLCDPELSLRVRMVASAFNVPIYTLGEHLLELGLSEVIIEIDGHPGGKEAGLKEKLHLLVEEIDPAQCLQRRRERLMLEAAKRDEDVKAALGLLRVIEEDGIPRGLALEIAEELIKAKHDLRKKREILRQLDQDTLKRLHAQLPDLVPWVIEVIEDCGLEEAKRLFPKTDQQPHIDMPGGRITLS